MKSRTKSDSLVERLRAGLQDGLGHVRGENTLKTTDVQTPSPPPNYSAEDIQRIRKRADMSQSMFARLLNISVKSVQSWEQGVRSPSQPALRLLQLMQRNPEFMHRVALGKAEDDEEQRQQRKPSRSRAPGVKRRRSVAMAKRGKPSNSAVRQLRSK